MTPYILAPRSVSAFTLRPLSHHSIKMEIFHFSYDLREMAFEGLTRMHRLVLYRCSEELDRYAMTELWLKPGRYRPSGTSARSLRSDRALARARSLCSDQAGRALGRYVATELWRELGRYVATERNDCSRPIGSDVRSLRSDRHRLGLGCKVATGQRVCAVVTQRPSLVRLLLNLQGYYFVKTSYWLSFFYKNYIFIFTISFENTISGDFWVRSVKMSSKKKIAKKGS
ncbi:hypothetical protein IGI04_035667 [Brassica rapa subsp. trilocularis]|uniref:Uncharacterized protein n=1 Tax=Brassica rapa subsp. trilocularis TaxID=1813537 RepID=A0ABQ7LCA6_BRACM|nr:hypothetical protein IGI04_035667 [Brassica rapa subsp. trilocularis]